LIDTALRSRPKGKTHWSGRGLAAETGLSKTTVHRYLSLFGGRTFKLSTDPLKIRVSVVRFRPWSTAKTLIHQDFLSRKTRVRFPHRDRFPFCFQTRRRRAGHQSDRACALLSGLNRQIRQLDEIVSQEQI
jgi:hypothetical protein